MQSELLLPLTKAAEASLPKATRIASVDDDSFTREMDKLAFEALGLEAFVRGATREEIDGFPDFVASLDPPPRWPPRLLLPPQSIHRQAHIATYNAP